MVDVYASVVPVLSCPDVYRLFYRTAILGPIFEFTKLYIGTLPARAERPPDAQYTTTLLSLAKILIVIRRVGIGAKLQHAARVMHGASNLAALLRLPRILHINDQRIAFGDHLTGFSGRIVFAAL